MEINVMRTLTEAAKMFKNEDPKTCITYSTLRRLCIEKKVKYIKCGNRYYINIDSVRQLMNI